MAATAEQERSHHEQPVERRLLVRGHELCLFEWMGERPTVLLAHATGFHARVWDAVARLLPGRRVLAVDLRGHGRSSRPVPPYTWQDFGEDLVGLAAALDLRGAIGVGHSMGGHSVTYAAAHAPERFAALLLVDPVIRTESGQPPTVPGVERPGGADFVSKRRNEWSSPEEMIERFRSRVPYSTWRPDVLEDYARYGLLPAPDGQGFVLACPPQLEAALYGMAAGIGLQREIAEIDVPVRVLRAPPARPGSPPFSGSPASPDLASRFPLGEDVLLPDRSHFIPMEAPEVVAWHIRDLVASLPPDRSPRSR